MAPVERLSHDELERTSLPPHLHEPHFSTLPSRRARARPRLTHPAEQLKDIIQDLYNIMVQVTTYDTTGRPSRDVLSNQVCV